MAWRAIRLINLQSHKDTTIELPKTGVVGIIGDNSAGKSVILKPIVFALDGRMYVPKTRKSLIRRGASEAIAIYTKYDGTVLKFCIREEASGTYTELITEEGTFKRYLSDREGYRKNITLFGIHFNDKYGISLNLHHDRSFELFSNTDEKLNYELITDIPDAVEAKESLLTIGDTLTVLRSKIKEAKLKIEGFDKAISQLPIIDKDVVAKKLNSLKSVRTDLSIFVDYLNPDTIPKVGLPPIEELYDKIEFIGGVSYPVDYEDYGTVSSIPEVKIFDAYAPICTIMNLLIPDVFKPLDNILDVSTIVTEIRNLQSSKCPTCGRRFE